MVDHAAQAVVVDRAAIHKIIRRAPEVVLLCVWIRRAKAAHGLRVFQHGAAQAFEHRIGLIDALCREEIALHRIPAVQPSGFELPDGAEQAVFRYRRRDHVAYAYQECIQSYWMRKMSI